MIVDFNFTIQHEEYNLIYGYLFFILKEQPDITLLVAHTFDFVLECAFVNELINGDKAHGPKRR